MRDLLKRKLLFVIGKGGTGKTSVSQALALAYSRQRLRTLWVCFEDPTLGPGQLDRISPYLHHLNCEASLAFEEYIGLKIGIAPIARFFLRNPVIRYLSKAAPGLHELVLLGKVWHERLNYDRVVIDMPATGHGVAMLQSTANFARLFKGGPIHRDAEAMLATFQDPAETGCLVVSLPEEMPLRESTELGELLHSMFPACPPAFLLNRRFPQLEAGAIERDPSKWSTPIAQDLVDYARKRSILEEHNLRLWNGIDYSVLPFVTPGSRSEVTDALSHFLAPAIAELDLRG